MKFSVLIVARNSAPILKNLLDSLNSCDDVILVNDRSTDNTNSIASIYENITIIKSQDLIKDDQNMNPEQNLFYGNEAYFRNLTLNSITYKYDWVLILDSDERVPSETLTALKSIKPEADQVAYSIKRNDIFLGKKLKYAQQVGFYTRLIKIDSCSYKRPINSYMVFKGKVKKLSLSFDHYPFALGLESWLNRHIQYSLIETQKALSSTYQKDNQFSLMNIISNPPRQFLKNFFYLLYFRGFLKFLLLYIFRLGFLDGAPGYIYCMLIAWYETLIEARQRIKMLEDRSIRSDLE